MKRPVHLFHFSLLIVFLCGVFAACTPEKERRFSLLSASRTNIDFVNQVKDTPPFNIFNYYNFYNGGGVAVGDVNNDGLTDLFFVGNEKRNKLYLNKGNFQFQDITDSAGVAGQPDSWSTGATMADVNADGYLDIYVSHVNYLTKSGANQLYINNQDGTFSERAAEYNLDFKGYSTQAAFFDYNKDGRLDMYLLNQSYPSSKIFGPAKQLRNQVDANAGDKLYRNEGGTFTDVTQQAGIYSSALGLGLGVAISDINKDGWLDIYVGNDAHEDDYLYINNGDGTFTESLSASMGHTSRSSMGNDVADFNNDGLVDILSVDMMPEDRQTYMSSGGPALYLVYQKYLDLGYGHNNERNTLQLNRGKSPDGHQIFSDIAFGSNVARTAWSWASLFLDVNNDGWKDLYVTNGMPRRTNNLDATRKSEIRAARSETQSSFETQEQLNKALAEIPPEKVANYAFLNNGDLTFSDQTAELGLDQKTTSSGASYADLDNDGDLDLIVNNTNMESYIYRNNTSEHDSTVSYLKIKLEGERGNTSGIGTKVTIYNEGQKFYQEQMPTRGFQSSVEPVLHFGLGTATEVDSVLIVWPDDSFQTSEQIGVNQTLTFKQEEATGTFNYDNTDRNWRKNEIRDVTDQIDIEFVHNENSFNDFKREPLMPYRLSTQGPALCVGDVTGNGLDDFYVGAAKGQSGKLFLQKSDGSFFPSNDEIFSADSPKEDVDAIFFDATGDGNLDLYVVSGGAEHTGYDQALADRLYINDGKGNFIKSEGKLPDIFLNGSVVTSSDYDGDGDQDLFLGGRSIPYRYGLSPRSYLLENDGSGNFKDVTENVAPQLKNIGMVTDAEWASLSNQKYPELIVAGEWMPVEIFSNNGSQLTPSTDKFGLSGMKGLWQSIFVEDVDDDGHQDIIAGNFGINSRMQPSTESPYRIYVNDFTGNDHTSPIIAKYIDGEYYPYEQLHELLMRIKFLVRRVNSYEDYSSKTMNELFGADAINSSTVKEVTTLSSYVFTNNGNSNFTANKLPFKAQLSPVMAIESIENDTGGKNILLGGNLFNVKQSVGGKQDASYGVHMEIQKDRAFRVHDLQSSGFFIDGEVRKIGQLTTDSHKLIVVARNDDSLKFFRLNREAITKLEAR